MVLPFFTDYLKIKPPEKTSGGFKGWLVIG
jgi:hypothetical protein